MFEIRKALVGAALLALVGGPAAAQNGAAPPATAGPSTEKTAPGTAPATNLDSRGGTLSDKLSDTNGVIRPTGDVDPAMRKPTPSAGSMPVIKPGTVAPGTAK